ncbi:MULTISPECIES: TIGR03862 family flavoprotein [Rubrivivax]|uniref:TIGR03862 family flavoprotein n=1 Tax=Rubrivivax benzoatilyticus TaxID=316997 RepID=A0ABX0HTP0_9BURK|nr:MULTISPECIES: TIGR03862 family flavoprotein [Rubrivivax]EGJ10420.1 flavoprotein oxidoreductase [Rubrivivax benzoatilyticus JA2 = ATCC BAA-35]NHK98392.1 TIGR03862 family flavoprotein [Rubrivivax benzoatilyticus]NHL23833.1 TIGR03862 family flavoprotein [Rubrivivax benzoatilyticus]
MADRLAVVIGAGPAGLMAAERLAAAGHRVEVFDAMPSAGRKFLLAGKGGLNLTHSEPFERFVTRYGPAAGWMAPRLQAFGADALRAWAAGLGVSTFVGTSGRVFPAEMKAAPLLRAWLHRLRAAGVVFQMRHRWTGWSDDGALAFDGPAGPVTRRADATILALGGASWPRLGSNGAWWPWLAARGVELAPLAPSNCGFDVAWSEFLRTRHAGEPLKSVAITFGGERRPGEFVLTETGVEGSLVYAFSAALRDAIARDGRAVFELDLLPARPLEWVRRELAHPRGSRSLASHLKSRLNLGGVKTALLWELVPKADQHDVDKLAAAIKALPVPVTAPRPIAEAISSAGGVRLGAVDDALMLHALPGVFVAGEMLDWEAPTGGYLLTGCFTTGLAAGDGAARWLSR